MKGGIEAEAENAARYFTSTRGAENDARCLGERTWKSFLDS